MRALNNLERISSAGGDWGSHDEIGSTQTVYFGHAIIGWTITKNDREEISSQYIQDENILNIWLDSTYVLTLFGDKN